MPVFRFRLAAVLRYRQYVREEKRLAFAVIEEEKARLVSEITALETLLTAQVAELAEQSGRMLTSAELRLRGEFAQQAVQRIQERRALLVAVEQKLAEHRAALLQADREVKSLERLRARLQERHRRQENTAEQKRVDEVGQKNYRSQKE
jgi:flagellar export protein FliJ